MRKKISLLIVGLAVFLGAFLLYQYVTNASWVGAHQAPQAPVVHVAADDGKLSLQERTNKGELLYDFTASTAIPVKDAQGKQLAGQYEVTNPSARYYMPDGRIASLRADRGTMAVDTNAKKKAQMFGGKLSGHIRMMLSPADVPVDDNGPKPGQIELTLDKDIEMSMTDSLLTSPGGVHVRSEDISFDGENLTVAFNRAQQRIEYLRIDPATGKDNEIVIRKLGQGNTSFMGDLGDTKGGKAAASMPATTQDALASKANAYKLSFGQDVVARLGTSELSSDRLFVLFMTPAKDKARDLLRGAPATEGATKPVATTQKDAPADAKDLRVTWRGPMEMRPLGPDDMTLTDEKDRALLAEGTKDHPVKVVDGKSEITAARLWYHKAVDRVELESDRDNQVCVNDPQIGLVKCRGLSYFRTTDKLLLAGPGTMDVPQSVMHREKAVAGAAPMVVTWDQTMDVELANATGAEGATDAAGSRKKTIRHALITGDVWFRDPGMTGVSNAFEMNAATLDLLMARSASAKMSQALENLVATAVRIKSARPGATLEDKPQGMNAQRLEVSTAAAPNGTLAPSKMVATGNVVAWTYEKQGDLAGDFVGGKKPEATAEKPLVKQTIHTPTMQVELEPREKTAKDNNAAAAAIDAGMAFGSSTGVKSLTATDGVKVELEGLDAVVTAKSLVADPRTGKVRLLGDPGLNQPNALPVNVLVTMGDDQIESSEMIFDQHPADDSHSIEIPREGTFVFVEKNEAGEKKTPVQIHWTQKMTYDRGPQLARFMGKVDLKTLGAAAETVEMTCKTLLEAKLGQREAGTAGGKKPPISEFKAVGGVELTDTKWDKKGAILTRMYTRTEEARYSEATRLLELPYAGDIGLEDNEVNTNPDKMDTAGKSVLQWQGGLTYAMDTGVITLTKDVHVIHVPNKPLQVAASGGKEGVPQTIQRIDMHGQTLTAKLRPGKPKTDKQGDEKASQTGGPTTFMGSDGRPDLDTVKIVGSARLIAGEDEISAPELDFDATKHIVSAKGTRQEPVHFVSPGSTFPDTTGIKWDLTKGHHDIEIEPMRGMMQLN